MNADWTAADRKVWEDVAALDLEPVIAAIVRKQFAGDESRRAEIAAWVADYRRFLFMCHKYPNEKLTPSETVDDIWHQHILFTRKYVLDCERIFGKYIHHNPSAEPTPLASNGGTVDEHREEFMQLAALYRKEFGLEFSGKEVPCAGGGGPCRSLPCDHCKKPCNH